MTYEDFEEAIVAYDRKDWGLKELEGIYIESMEEHIENYFTSNTKEKRQYYLKEAFEFLQCYIVVKVELMKRRHCT